MRGQITQVQEHVIQCGRCPDLSVTMQTGSPHAMARRMGWSKRKGYGWICPECVIAVAEQVERLKAENLKRRGFGHPGISEARQREIAASGGREAHKRGTAHEWARGSEEAREAGRLGGIKSGRNRKNTASSV